MLKKVKKAQRRRGDRDKDSWISLTRWTWFGPLELVKDREALGACSAVLRGCRVRQLDSSD